MKLRVLIVFNVKLGILEKFGKDQQGAEGIEKDKVSKILGLIRLCIHNIRRSTTRERY